MAGASIRVRAEQRQQAQRRARSRRRRGSRPTHRPGRGRRHRRGQRQPGPDRRVRYVVRGAVAAVRASRGDVGHRLRHRRARARPGGPPTRCSTRCRRRCRGRGRQPDGRCCPRTASHPPPLRYRPRGRRSSRTTTGCVTARGDYIDFSRFEAVVQSLDPPFGSEGQAAVGQKRSNELWRGRPRNQQIYPTFECRDGYVRICLLSARQWRGMRAWLGEPEQFQDPKFDTIAARYGASREINALIAELFATQTMDELVTAGAGARGADRRGAQPGRDVELRALPIRRRADRRRPSHRASTSPCLSAPLSSTGAMRDSCGRRRRWVVTKQPGAQHDPSPRPDPTPPPRTGRSTVCGSSTSA